MRERGKDDDKRKRSRNRREKGHKRKEDYAGGQRINAWGQRKKSRRLNMGKDWRENDKQEGKED